MAYHYAYHKFSGDRRRILTESVPRYERDGYLVYSTQHERDAAHPTWWLVRYASERIEGPVNARTAREYYSGAHMRAGYALFHDRGFAEAALAANVSAYRINSFSGKVRRVPTWLAPNERDAFEGYEAQEFPSVAAAMAAFPPSLVALKDTANPVKIYPGQKSTFEHDGYMCGASVAEILSSAPVRWHFIGGRYRRSLDRGTCRAPSQFAKLRAAIRALDVTEPPEYSFTYNGKGPEFSVRDAITQAASAVLQFAYERNSGLDTQAVTRKTLARFNAMLPGKFESCADCQNNLVILPFAQRHNGRAICSYCVSNYHACRRCSVLLHDDERLEDDNGRTYCRDHWTPPAPVLTGSLLGYSTDVTKRLPTFLTARGERPDDKKSIWLGWELEVHAKEGDGEGECQACDECAETDSDGERTGDCCDSDCSCHVTPGKASAVKRVQEATSAWAICKEDGSLENGFEIVSVPASLAWHAANVKPWLERAKAHISGWPHNDCGLHVHVGIKQLSQLTQGKMLTFMQAPENQAFITAIAGRDTNTYCVRGEKKKIPDYRCEHTRGRYQGLNFSTRGRKTVEFRIFRSNVAPAGFMKALEFCHATVSWCRFASMQDVAPGQHGIKRATKGDAPAAFVAYVKRERSTYPHLARWMEANDYLPRPRIHPDAPIAQLFLAA